MTQDNNQQGQEFTSVTLGKALPKPELGEVSVMPLASPVQRNLVSVQAGLLLIVDLSNNDIALTSDKKDVFSRVAVNLKRSSIEEVEMDLYDLFRAAKEPIRSAGYARSALFNAVQQLGKLNSSTYMGKIDDDLETGLADSVTETISLELFNVKHPICTLVRQPDGTRLVSREREPGYDLYFSDFVDINSYIRATPSKVGTGYQELNIWSSFTVNLCNVYDKLESEDDQTATVQRQIVRIFKLAKSAATNAGFGDLPIRMALKFGLDSLIQFGNYTELLRQIALHPELDDETSFEIFTRDQLREESKKVPTLPEGDKFDLLFNSEIIALSVSSDNTDDGEEEETILRVDAVEDDVDASLTGDEDDLEDGDLSEDDLDDGDLSDDLDDDDSGDEDADADEEDSDLDLDEEDDELDG